MANQTVIKLQDGNVMPQLGLGVWKAGNDEVVSAIHKAPKSAIGPSIPPPPIKTRTAWEKRLPAPAFPG